jgi:hypothetical protein
MHMDEVRAICAAASHIPEPYRGQFLGEMTAWALANLDLNGELLSPMPGKPNLTTNRRRLGRPRKVRDNG